MKGHSENSGRVVGASAVPEGRRGFGGPRRTGRMSGEFVLVARSADHWGHWEMPLKEGRSVILGRQPRDGFAVPWDAKISREHVQLSLRAGRVHVQKLKSARNAVYHRGKSVGRFELEVGESFRIGGTRFELRQVDPLLQKLLKAVDRFVVKKKLGVGPSGHVYAALDRETSLPVALKVFHPELAAQPPFRKRVLLQAKTLRDIEHANIARLILADMAEGVLFQASELVPGKSVARMVQEKGPLPLRRTVEIAAQVLRGLEALAARGLVHRNLKPANVVSRVGTMKLTDIGLDLPAGWVARSEHGELTYFPPEQLDGRGRCDLRSDLYALGCVWFYMITGQPPFPGDDPRAVAAAIRAASRPDPRQFHPKCGPRLAQCVLDLMAADPDHRPQSVADVLETMRDPALVGLSVVCKNCGTAFAVSSKLSGRTVPCKECSSPLRVPVVLE
ncbi:MAG: FHA domain-containing protein [Planctomycetota bacterium]|nr:MAG: FHA domain-containing protein [Planctomycetota bacterium]